MMKYLSARARIAFGLVCLVSSVLSVAMMLQIIPDRQASQLSARSKLCEVIAISSSEYISRGEFTRLEHLLHAIAQRNPDLQSIGLRSKDGTLIRTIGNHDKWQLETAPSTSDHQLEVPVRSGTERWGAVELRFVPLHATGLWRWIDSQWLQMSLFTSSFCYLLFFYYLGKMLQHLDPSKSVPKRVRAALDSLAEGLLVVDRNYRIVLANQAMSEWVDQPADQLIGLHASKLGWVSDENLSPMQTYPWVAAIEQKTAQAGIMLCLSQPGKPLRVLMANASPVLGNAGDYRGVLISFDDVTQLENTRKDLDVAKQLAENSRQAAEDANHAKSEFLARMSHEIRTPMNAILGYTDVLRRGFDACEEDRQEYLNTIHHSGEHLLALINDILDLSKIESGKLELELERNSPHQLIQQVVGLLRSKAIEKGIELTADFIGKIPESISVDVVRFRQTIVNLVGNAIKFTEKGKVQIVTRMEIAGTPSHPKCVMAFDIVDSGIGIAPDALQKIFDPFSQADTSITRRFGGTGLGLSISKQLAEAMGGDIQVQSTLGKGSTFTVRLDPGPLEGIAFIEGDHSFDRVASQKSNESLVRRLPPCRILVADDGESNRKLIRLVLSKAGVDVTVVENGKLAVEKAITTAYDIILMDMQMPVMDGYTATSLLREHGFSKPIIALTAHAMQGDEEKCRDAGCSGFLTKPINIDRLLATLAVELGEASDVLIDEKIENTLEKAESLTEKALSANFDVDAESIDIPCSYPLDDPDYLEIALEFRSRLQSKLLELGDQSSPEDDSAIATFAHWLKGSGGTAGFEAFTPVAKSLEKSIKDRDHLQIKNGLARIQRMIDGMQWLNELEPSEIR